MKKIIHKITNQENRTLLLIAIGAFIIFIISLAVLFLKDTNSQKNPLSNINNSTQSETTSSTTPDISIATSTPSEPQKFVYFEVVDSCGPYFAGDCVNMRSGPGTQYPVVKQLRTGIVFKIADTVNVDGEDWYQVDVDKSIKFPERVKSKWYVAAKNVELFYDTGDKYLQQGVSAPTQKQIVVIRSKQMLYAYDGEDLFMEAPVSTGLEFTPTPRGTFTVFKMTPSRYMQGPIPGVSDQYYDLPGVPWNLYFTADGAVIHGAYWHDHFGKVWSHGCVNLSLDMAKKLYLWADIGTKVTIL